MHATRRTVLKALVGSGVGLLAGSAGYGFLYARHALQLTEATLEVAGLPPELDGFRIGLITDVHRSQWVSHEDVVHACETLMRARPDLVALCGDYVSFGDRDYAVPAAESLSSLSAPQGVFAVLGNHDDDHEMTPPLTAQGITVLNNARTRLSIRGATLELAGIRFWTRRQSDIADVLKGATGTTVLLAHDPRRLTEAAALNVPLVLSGHTHGGQIVLPVGGAIAAQKFPVVAGIGKRRSTTLFVSRGVGTVYVPIRLNCPPEVSVLTLRPSGTAG